MALPPDYRNEESLWWCLTHDKGFTWEWERSDLMREVKNGNSESDEKSRRKAQRREFIRITLLDLLGFVLVLYFVWPTSHVLALWSFVAFTAIQFAF
jgi:hypothetical protein